MDINIRLDRFLLIGSSHHNFSASYTFPCLFWNSVSISVIRFGSIAYYNKLGGRFLLRFIFLHNLLTVTVDDLLRLASTWQAGS